MKAFKFSIPFVAIIVGIVAHFVNRDAASSSVPYGEGSEIRKGTTPVSIHRLTGVEPRSRALAIGAEERAEAGAALREQALKLLDQAKSDWESQTNYAEAFVLMQQAAENGSIEAFKDMAYMAERGLGVEKSSESALEYFMRAAELGDAEAMLAVGDFLDGDRGVRTNYLLAAEWYAEAASAGVAEASARLGQLYAAGRGVVQDYAMANELYLDAAEGGSPKGNLYLGLAHLEGWGVESDASSALGYMELAANAGDAQAQYALYKLYSDGQHVAADEEVALEWLRRSVTGGDDDSLRAYARAGSRAEELLGAIDLLGGLSESESAAASFELAKMSLKYDQTQGGAASALAFAESAAAQGDRRANLMLAYLSAQQADSPGGTSLSQLTRPAEDWLAAGAAAEDPRSIYALRLMEQKGFDVSQAIDAARKATTEEIYKYGSEYNAQKSGGENSPPSLTGLVAASYPEGLELQGFSGRVMVELIVSETGEVVQSRVVNQEHPELTDAALSAVSQWTFKPGLKNGQPATSSIRVPVNFRN